MTPRARLPTEMHAFVAWRLLILDLITQILADSGFGRPRCRIADTANDTVCSRSRVRVRKLIGHAASVVTRPQHLRPVDCQLATLWRHQSVRKSAKPPVDGRSTRDLASNGSSGIRHRRAGARCGRLLTLHYFPALATG